jgi:hypothetical protein
VVFTHLVFGLVPQQPLGELLVAPLRLERPGGKVTGEVLLVAAMIAQPLITHGFMRPQVICCASSSSKSSAAILHPLGQRTHLSELKKMPRTSPARESVQVARASQSENDSD